MAGADVFGPAVRPPMAAGRAVRRLAELFPDYFSGPRKQVKLSGNVRTDR